MLVLHWEPGIRMQTAKSTWYLPGILKDGFCLEKPHEMRVIHSKKRGMIATRCRSCAEEQIRDGLFANVIQPSSHSLPLHYKIYKIHLVFAISMNAV